MGKNGHIPYFYSHTVCWSFDMRDLGTEEYEKSTPGQHTMACERLFRLRVSLLSLWWVREDKACFKCPAIKSYVPGTCAHTHNLVSALTDLGNSLKGVALHRFRCVSTYFLMCLSLTQKQCCRWLSMEPSRCLCVPVTLPVGQQFWKSNGIMCPEKLTDGRGILKEPYWLVPQKLLSAK